MSEAAINAYIDGLATLDSNDRFRSPGLTDSLSSTSSESRSPTDSLQDWSSSSQVSDQTFLKQLQTDIFGSVQTWTQSEDADYFGQFDSMITMQDPNDKSIKQMKRKAQNRAAQRAFRERKERSMRELEESVTSLRSKAADLEVENKRLATLLQEARIEVKTLKSFPSLQAASNPKAVAPSVSCRRVASDVPSEIILRINLGDLAGAPAFVPADGSSLRAEGCGDGSP